MNEDIPARHPVGVVGAGTMGVGVAQCFARSGYPVVVVEPVPAARESAPRRLREGLRLDRLLNRTPAVGTIADIESRVRWTARLDGLSAARFVVECVREHVGVKEQVFRALDRTCPEEAVLASCTSAIPVTLIGSWTDRPERVLGLHFMNPAPLKDTVEVVKAPTTGEATLEAATALLATIGKKGVVVGDAPGFVSNRVLMLTVNEAAALVHEGTADAETVDRVFQDCFGHPTGPLRTADLIGLDTVVDSLVVLREHTGDPKFEPCPLLAELVARGRTGRKNGRGFHAYANGGQADGRR